MNSAVRVLGRMGELCAIDAFLDGLPDPGAAHRVALITGESGVGKTLLWDEGRARAEARGYTVLSARPVEPESALGFAGLGDLFDDVPTAVIDGLPGPQRHALLVALLRADVGDTPADPRSVATAALTALRTLAVSAPVLIAVDDLAWLDASTRRVLAFGLRRLDTEPVGLLATVRTEAGTLPGLATDDVPAERVQTIVPAALTLGAIRELLAERLQFAPNHRLLVRIHEASGGNPYYAMELARQLARGGVTRADDELAVPDTLRRLVHRRLARLARPVRDVLLTAALAPGSAPEIVFSAAPDPDVARSHLAAAVEAGVVEAGHAEVTFTHPLLRSVLIDDAAPRLLRATHARLAEVAEPQLASPRHRALAADGPDEGVAVALDNAAGTAQLRGASDTAADLADLAIALTPTDLAGAVRRRTIAAAELRFDAGDPGRARALVGQLATAEPAGPGRAALLLQLAKYARHSGEPLPGWTATLEQALAETGQQDVALRMAIHFALGFAAYNGGDPATGPVHVAAFTELAERLDDRFLDAQAAAGIAYVRYASGAGLRADLVDRALRAGPGSIRVPVEESPTYTIAVALAHYGDVDRARELVERDLAEARDRGNEACLPIVAWLLVRLETWSGNWSLAEQHAEDGRHASELAGNPFGVASVCAARAVLRAAQGRDADARSDAAEALDVCRRVGLFLPAQLAAEALGLLALSRGDAPGALEAVRGVTDQALRAGFVEPGLLRTLPLELEARARTRDVDGARALLERMRSSARTGSPWTAATALRCEALLLVAAADLPAAERVVTEAVSSSGTLAMPFEHARTLLVAGEIHRRARHRKLARESLTQAQGLFDRLGATVWSARCADELERAAGRPAPAQASDALTATERRVADLAAEGYTTREIAGTLFTGVRTVEAHLQHVYRKLGVRSRVELSRLLGETGTAP